MTDMRLRVIQRCLSYTISQRMENTERVSFSDLWFSRKFVEKININVPYAIAWYLKHNSSGIRDGTHICGGQYVTRIAKSNASGIRDGIHICGGQYVTRIAKSFGVSFGGLQRVTGKHMTVGFAHFRGCNAVIKEGNRYKPFEEEEEEEEEEEQVDSSPPRRRMKLPNVVEDPQLEEDTGSDHGADAGTSYHEDTPRQDGPYSLMSIL